MIFNVSVTVSLKSGMLDPEASTIERSLDLLGYNVTNTSTENIISFSIEDESKESVEVKVRDMCERLLCNPVIHDYSISIKE